jgi:RNA polymerase sigma-70 factor (ECF subfamily)
MAAVQSDAELLGAWSDGDRFAGNELFERHFDSVRRFFDNKIGGDIEDLIQHTFLSCLEGLPRFKRASTFRSFLFGVARNVLREFFREKSRLGRKDDFEDANAADFAAGPSTIVAHKREQRVLLEALRRLPMDIQVLLELHYWERLRGRELAEILEINENTVRSRLRRARQLLEEQIKVVASSEDLRRTTLANLEGWAEELRQALLARAGDLEQRARKRETAQT